MDNLRIHQLKKDICNHAGVMWKPRGDKTEALKLQTPPMTPEYYSTIQYLVISTWIWNIRIWGSQWESMSV